MSEHATLSTKPFGAPLETSTGAIPLLGLEAGADRAEAVAGAQRIRTELHAAETKSNAQIQELECRIGSVIRLMKTVYEYGTIEALYDELGLHKANARRLVRWSERVAGEDGRIDERKRAVYAEQALADAAQAGRTLPVDDAGVPSTFAVQSAAGVHGKARAVGRTTATQNRPFRRDRDDLAGTGEDDQDRDDADTPATPSERVLAARADGLLPLPHAAHRAYMGSPIPESLLERYYLTDAQLRDRQWVEHGPQDDDEPEHAATPASEDGPAGATLSLSSIDPVEPGGQHLMPFNATCRELAQNAEALAGRVARGEIDEESARGWIGRASALVDELYELCGDRRPTG